MKNYKATEEYIKRYIKKKCNKEDIILRKLNYEFIIEFESFIRNHPVQTHYKFIPLGD